jgi:hypothetical protein
MISHGPEKRQLTGLIEIQAPFSKPMARHMQRLLTPGPLAARNDPESPTHP